LYYIDYIPDTNNTTTRVLNKHSNSNKQNHAAVLRRPVTRRHTHKGRILLEHDMRATLIALDMHIITLIALDVHIITLIPFDDMHITRIPFDIHILSLLFF
jgi:hypothetical protein